jgi:hypothetical protein
MIKEFRLLFNYIVFLCYESYTKKIVCERNSELFNVKADITLSVCFVSLHIFC